MTTTLASLGEFGFISRLAAAVQPGVGVVTGIGDDAAVTVLTPGMHLLASADMLLEDVHFRRSWHDPYRLGRKSLAVNISDIAAMGAIPRWALLCLAIPADMPLEFLDAFNRGVLAMAAEHGVTLIGGDTCSSRDRLAISVTIMGEQHPERILRRSGAQPGEEIWVSGCLGDAALGLRLLEKGTAPWSDDEQRLLARLLDPTPRSAFGIALAESGLVSAMIDISDGLLSDFGHMARLSGVGGEIQLAVLPLSAPFRSATAHLPTPPYHLCLSGGEDYELAFTAPAEHREKILGIAKKCGIDATPVGIVTSSAEIAAFDAEGHRYTPEHQGFNHFT